MTGAEHYAEAERFLALAWEDAERLGWKAHRARLAVAQVHATLALAAGAGGPVELWVAYYGDWSGMAVFTTELDARRYADDGRSMEVAQVQPGQDLREAVR